MRFEQMPQVPEVSESLEKNEKLIRDLIDRIVADCEIVFGTEDEAMTDEIFELSRRIDDNEGRLLELGVPKDVVSKIKQVGHEIGRVKRSLGRLIKDKVSTINNALKY